MAEKRRKNNEGAPSGTHPELIPVNKEAKARLDHIKQVANVETYDEAISFLYSAWKKNLKSMAGAFHGSGPFEREEDDDPYRLPNNSDTR